MAFRELAAIFRDKGGAVHTTDRLMWLAEQAKCPICLSAV